MSRTNRTSAYRFTVRMVNGQVHPEDQAAVDGLRTVVKLGNTAFQTQQYVKLQGRGHRMGVYRYNQSLPLTLATSADVYVYNR
jgi:hypothetical protein